MFPCCWTWLVNLRYRCFANWDLPNTGQLVNAFKIQVDEVLQGLAGNKTCLLYMIFIYTRKQCKINIIVHDATINIKYMHIPSTSIHSMILIIFHVPAFCCSNNPVLTLELICIFSKGEGITGWTQDVKRQSGSYHDAKAKYCLVKEG